MLDLNPYDNVEGRNMQPAPISLRSLPTLKSISHQPYLYLSPPNTHHTDGLSYHPAVTKAVAYLDDTAPEDEQSSKSRVAGPIRLNALRPHKVGYRHEHHRHDVDENTPPHVRQKALVQHERLRGVTRGRFSATGRGRDRGWGTGNKGLS